MFQILKLDDLLKYRITGRSFPNDISSAKITYEDLRYVLVDHVDFCGNVKQGELIVNARIAEIVVSIFKELLDVKYPIEKMLLIDEYNADDESSMSDNNSSAFNYRVISGTNKLSNHGLGLAIDINPLYNPYISANPAAPIQPANSAPYVDRSKDFPHKLTNDDICVKIFKKYGFSWGGDWTDTVDYQHFEFGARAK